MYTYYGWRWKIGKKMIEAFFQSGRQMMIRVDEFDGGEKSKKVKVIGKNRCIRQYVCTERV